MNIIDRFYTPDALAKILVESAGNLRPKLVADFAVGGGSLLHAAERLWPSSTFIGTDIDSLALKILKSTKKHWRTGKCDFLNERSRAACSALRGIKETVSLLLLNPPFSLRRGRLRRPSATHQALCDRLSPSLAFLKIALQYLADDGEARIVLPASAITAERDRFAFQSITKGRTAEIIHRSEKGFATCSATTFLIGLSPARSGDHCEQESIARSRSSNYTEMGWIGGRVVRGGFQMHWPQCDGGQGRRLVHSTDLAKGELILRERYVDRTGQTIDSPAVLIPRVGRISPGKIVLFRGESRIQLSDCVFAVVVDNCDAARIIKARILENFASFAANFNGTGAPYLTISKLTCFLATIGVRCGEQSKVHAN